MNASFPGPSFLLETPEAEKLYHEYAALMPILDYHNHLPPAEVAGNRQFSNLTEIWLSNDHYKWRAMRAAGINEHFITGKASDREKFNAWASVVPQTLRNPLYHWTHMELRNPLGIPHALLGPETAEEIWRTGNANLQHRVLSVQGLLANWNIKLICTTDDPTDDLIHHREYNASRPACRMIPAFRPDRVLGIHETATWNAWVDLLEQASGIEIHNLETLLKALNVRCDYFHQHGCRLSDHGLEFISATILESEQADKWIAGLRRGVPVGNTHIPGLTTYLMTELCRMYHARNWTQQLHLGALRNVNAQMFNQLGRDAGYDTIGDFPQARGLASFLSRLNDSNQLARTIVYNLNPADNEMIAAITGCFQDGVTPGKIQYGSGWWFLDQKDGMERQLNALSNLGLLSRFVGMLTDSRSFLSFSRHEYFRRVLCNMLGNDIKNGLLPEDFDLIGNMIRDICYRNARRYFQFDESAKKDL